MKTLVLVLCMVVTLAGMAGATNRLANGDLETWGPDSFAPSDPWYSKAVQPTTQVVTYRNPYNTAFSDGSGAWLTGWSADGYGFDYCTSNYFQAASGSRYVRLAGNVAGGGFYAGLAAPLTIGETYKLSFSMAGDLIYGPDVKALKVTVYAGNWGVIATPTFTWDGTGKVGTGLPYGSDPGWEQHEIVFTATTTGGFVAFENANVNGTSNGGAFIDNINLDAVPEPCSLLALGAGLVGLIARRRR